MMGRDHMVLRFVGAASSGMPQSVNPLLPTTSGMLRYKTRLLFPQPNRTKSLSIGPCGPVNELFYQPVAFEIFGDAGPLTVKLLFLYCPQGINI